VFKKFIFYVRSTPKITSTVRHK